MISKSSFINTTGEYAYDCVNRTDMLLRDDEPYENAVKLYTQYGNIIVTESTRIATDKGLWKRADQYNVGNSVRHYINGSATITGIEYIKDMNRMFKLVDCDCGYLIVNNFYISRDV